MSADNNRRRGRSTYTQEVADEILRRLAEGESLRSICRSLGMPPESTVRTWARDDREGFATKYARARDIGLDVLADEILTIADNASGDWQRDKLRIDARKWYLSKLAPKRYGERVAHEHSGPANDPIRIGLPPDELKSLRAFLADTGAVPDAITSEGEKRTQ